MLHLPKFVRECLKASVSPVGHPDPDMLTAFSERSLPAHERDVVMEHLARCGECRDVVALALPATEAVTEPAPAAHRDWFRWPVLRWGAVAAGILIVAAIGVQQYRARYEPLAAFTASKRTSQNGTAQGQVARNEAPKAEMPVPAPEAPSVTSPAREDSVAAEHAPAASVLVRPSLNQPPALLRPHRFDRAKEGSAAGAIGGPIHGAVGAQRYDFRAGQGTDLAVNPPSKNPFAPALKSAPATQTNQSPSSVQKVPPRSEMVEVQSESGAVTTRDQSQVQSKDQQLDLYQTQQQQANAEQLYAENDKTLSKAKQPTQQVQVSGAVAPAPTSAPPPQPVLTARNLVFLPAPAWTITPAGGLQRSFDNGKTWQDVSVPAYPATVADLMRSNESVAVYAQASSEKREKEKKKDAKSAKQSNPAPIFRAVAANGLDVWAGGSAGALFHSVDAGDHWTRIFPLAGSTLLTADITSIQFSDPQHGAITTTSELWTTTDAGSSWQKH